MEENIMGVLKEFRDFILRGNVVDLAVGIIIGAAFGAVVAALVKDLITPLIGIFGHFDFSSWYFTINGSKFLIGDFLNVLLTFIIIAAVVFFLVVRPVNSLMNLYKKPEPEVSELRDCPYCKSSISKEATRCPYCTSEVQALASA
jgi:large conductance mechanosensitive channel